MNRGAVAQELGRVLGQHVAEHGIVLWFDGPAAFKSVADGLEIPGASLLHFLGSWYQVQHKAEKFLSKDERPSIVVYLPGLDGLDGTPLSELGAIGDSYKEHLHSVAHRALAGLGMSQTRIGQLLSTPNLTLDLVEEAAALETGVPEPLRPIFGGASPEELLIRTLSEDAVVLERIRTAGVEPQLASYLAGLVEIPTPEAGELAQVLWERILTTEFVWDLKNAAAPEKAAAVASKDRVIRDLCHRVAERLRRMGDDESRRRYRERSQQVAQTLDLEHAAIDALALGTIDTFAMEERRLLRAAVERALSGDIGVAREIVGQRRNSFWLREDAGRQAAWNAAGLALDLLAQIETARPKLPAVTATVATWLEAYTREGGFFELDRLARRMEREAGRAADGDLHELVTKVRGAYASFLDTLTLQFSETLDRKGFAELPSLPRQRAVFHERVEPYITDGPVAYILADALRFEMAADLKDLVEGASATLEARIAELPTITAVGMSALLPGAERGIDLLTSGPQLGLAIDRIPVFDRSRRKDLFEHRIGSKVEVYDLDAYMSMRRESPTLKPPRLLVAFWGDVDSFGEHGSLEGLRQHFSQMVERLARAVRELGEAGFRRVVVVSDHGHVFSESRGREHEVEPPSGAPIVVQRRCWVGRGPVSTPDVMTVSAATEGLGGDLDLAFPRGLSVLKPQAGKPFFHGGVSLHELVIPVLTFEFPLTRQDSDGRHFRIKPMGEMGPSGILAVEVRYDRGELFGEASVDVQVVGVSRGEIVTCLVSAPGLLPGTEVVSLRHANAVICVVQVDRRKALDLSLEIRTKDGGRRLGVAAETVTLPTPVESPIPVTPPPVQEAMPDEIMVAVPGSALPRRLRLSFVPSDAERKVLERLAVDGILTERAVGILLGRKGAAFFMASLVDKLVTHGHYFIDRGDESDEGAVFHFRREKLGGN